MNKIHQKYEVSVGAGVTPRSDRSGEAFSYIIPHTSGVKLWTFHVCVFLTAVIISQKVLIQTFLMEREQK